jgi:hypothetical protein
VSTRNDSPEYDDFLEDLQSVVAERVEALRARQGAQTPKEFLDGEKVVLHWPDIVGHIVEDYR